MKTKIVPILFTIVAASLLTLVKAQETTYNYSFIHSLDQKAAGCGYYALANAHAVQQLFNQGQAINEANIKQLAEELLVSHFTPFYKGMYDNLSVEEKRRYDNNFLHYAESNSDLLATDNAYSEETNNSTFFTMLSNEHNRLENAYAIQYIGNTNQPNIIRIIECLNNDTNGNFIANINNTERSITHFLYNLGSYEGGHWVYVGIVKEPGKIPYIIHLNSTNNDSLQTSNEFKDVIQHLINCMRQQKPLITDNEQPPVHNQEQINIENAIKESLKILEESDFTFAQKLQEADDLQFAKKLQEEECINDAAIAFALTEEKDQDNQIAEDADFAYALSLADEDNF